MRNHIESLITLILTDLLSQAQKREIFIEHVNGDINNNNFYDKKNVIVSTRKVPSFPKLSRSHVCSTQKFASFLYILAEVHELFLFRSHCTYRQLYYRNVYIECNMFQIRRAVSHVCDVLDTTSWNLGIFSAGKCFVSGPLVVHMSNGDIIDCNEFKGATLLPSNFTYIDKFETMAKFVLVIEKNTVFQFLIANDIFSLLNGNIILLTARGYPDICSRWILHKLLSEIDLNAYALVDGDPFGIEIMLIYRYGSLAKNVGISCPQLKWLGVHATDITYMSRHIEPLTANDYNKIKSLLGREYLDEETRNELLLLQALQCKVKVDNISSNIIEYIINKIKRQITL